MKRFFQRRAGATFFEGTSMTFAVRKTYFELFFKLENGWAACINVVPANGGLFLLADTGKLGNAFDEVIPKVAFDRNEFAVAGELLTGRHQLYKFGVLEMPNIKEPLAGIYRIIPVPDHENLLEIPSKKDVINESIHLVRFVSRFYDDIRNSLHPEIKSLARHFAE